MNTPTPYSRLQTQAPSLTESTTADVVVIGAGITGLSAASSLIECGLPASRIVVLEAKGVGEGDSALHAGILNAAYAEPYCRLHSSLGENAARLRRFAYRNLKRMSQLSEQFGFDWQLQLSGAVQAAGSDQEEAELKESVPLLQADGFPVEFLSAKDLSSRVGFVTQWGGIFDENSGGGNPVMWLHGMARSLQHRGVRLFTESQVARVSSSAEGTVEINLAGSAELRVRSECAVLAVNAQGPEMDDTLQHLVFPRPVQMLSFALAPSPASPSVSYQFGKFQIRRQPDGRLFVGGCRHLIESGKSAAVLAEHIQHQLYQFAQDHFPELKNLQPQARWSGRQAHTADGLPIIGPHPSRQGVLLCLGFNGFGFNNAAEAGHLTAELILNGTAPDADLFSPRRLL